MVIHGTRSTLTVLHVLWTAPENCVKRNAYRDSGLIKVGLVGCGRISQAAHLPALAKADA